MNSGSSDGVDLTDDLATDGVTTTDTDAPGPAPSCRHPDNPAHINAGPTTPTIHRLSITEP